MEKVEKTFIAETKTLLDTVKNSRNAKDAVQALNTLKGNAHILKFDSIEKLCAAIQAVYQGIVDDNVKMSERLEKLFELVSEKIISLAQKKGKDDSATLGVYFSCCDKIARGELLDSKTMTQEIHKAENIIDDEDDDEIDSTDGTVAGIQSVHIKLSRLNEIITDYDALITREFRLKRQLDSLRKVEENHDIPEITQIRKQLATDIESLEEKILSVQQQIFDLRMFPLSMVLTPLRAFTETTAKSHNKQVEFEIAETKITVDKEILEHLGGILEGLIVAAIENGIETPEERKALQKNAAGKLSLTFSSDQNYAEICVKDDGRGINFNLLRENIITTFPEMAAEINEHSDRELLSYLFKPGFASHLSEVQTEVEKIKGKISIETEQGKGSMFRLTFPLSLATSQGIFISCLNWKFMLQSQYIDDIIYRKRDQLTELQSRLFLKLGNEVISVHSLDSLLENNGETNNKDECTIVVAKYMEQKIGIIVDDIQRYVSLAVKPLPKSFKNFSILQGIVFDEHYAIVPILHLPQIIARFKEFRDYNIKKIEAKTEKREHKILIADGSSTALQIERSALENEGFTVDVATDGITALEKMKERHYDLIISATEMPRMNGATLLENVRRNEDSHNTPMIIVFPEQNETAMKAFKKNGANAFIDKSQFSRNVMIAKVKELLNA